MSTPDEALAELCHRFALGIGDKEPEDQGTTWLRTFDLEVNDEPAQSRASVDDRMRTVADDVPGQNRHRNRPTAVGVLFWLVTCTWHGV